MNPFEIYAQVGAAPQQPWWQFPALMLAVFAIIYFFMIRPQQKKQKELQEQRDALTTGSRIMTAGGIYGVIKDIKEKEFVVEISEGVRIRVDKGSVFPAA